jgi:hypothetical protein
VTVTDEAGRPVDITAATAQEEDAQDGDAEDGDAEGTGDGGEDATED